MDGIAIGIACLRREGGMAMKATSEKSSVDVYVFILLVALELLMSFTFLGYMHIPPISVTFAYIPILIAACLLGPLRATMVGAAFGLASMYKSTAAYVMPTDMIFSPFRSGYPLSSLILSVGTRALFGFLAGSAFYLAKRSKHPRLWMGVAAAITPKLHAVLVYIAIALLFPDIMQQYLATFYLQSSDLIMICLCIGIAEGLWKAYHSEWMCRFKQSIDDLSKTPDYVGRRRQMLSVIFVMSLVSMGITILAAIYFSQRTSYMLGRHGIETGSIINRDLVHLQIQFLMAMLSLNVILMVTLDSCYQYMEYQKYLGEMDSLTNVMGRRIFLKSCEAVQIYAKRLHTEGGWFLFLDADRFKQINDTFGHAVGDTVLKGVAAAMERNIGEYGMIGRMGGDEFAAMLHRPLSREALMERLDRFQVEIATILPEGEPVSCSIGVCGFRCPVEMPVLVRATDEMLYEAKRQGRARYIIREHLAQEEEAHEG